MDSRAWDVRYAASDRLWSAGPNRFVEQELGAVEPRGRALDLACGEGRNAIWLAERGWSLCGVDFSPVALERARSAARERGVDVQWILADVTQFQPPKGAFELVLIAYLQLPGAERRRVLAGAAAALTATGELFLIGHARRNLSEGTGGPRDPEVLWEPQEIAAELRALGLAVRRCEHVTREVETEEGPRIAIDTLARASAELP